MISQTTLLVLLLIGSTATAVYFYNEYVKWRNIALELAVKLFAEAIQENDNVEG